MDPFHHSCLPLSQFLYVFGSNSLHLQHPLEACPRPALPEANRKCLGLYVLAHPTAMTVLQAEKHEGPSSSTLNQDNPRGHLYSREAPHDQPS